MKTFAWLILFGFVSQAALSQHKGSTGRIYDTPDKLVQNNKFNIVESNKIKGLEDYMLELFPGQVFSGWYYYWSNGDALNCNLKEYPEVEWLNVSPKKFISTGCSDIIPVRYSIQAPITEGLYETILVDSTKNWDSTRVKLRVTSTPSSYTRKRMGINKDLISYKTFFRNNPLNWDSNSCVSDYYPADSIGFVLLLAFIFQHMI